MSENEKRAERAFRQTCAYLDKRGWKYDKDEEELSIRTAVRGEDIPIPMNLRINVEMQILQMLSTMPFEIPAERRIDGALAICETNYLLREGAFDFSTMRGNVCFRMNMSYFDSELTEGAVEKLILMTIATVERYNDRLYDVSQGKMSLEEYIKTLRS